MVIRYFVFIRFVIIDKLYDFNQYTYNFMNNFQ